MSNLLAAFILFLHVPAAGAAETLPQGTDPAIRLRAALLGGSRPRILCPGCPGEAALRFDPETGLATEISLPYERVNALAPFPGGDRLLAATSSEKGKRSQLLVLSAESLAPLGRVEIPGNGERLVVSADGYFAYVISHRPDRGEVAGSEAGEYELLAVDLGKSQVASSYPLPSAGHDLALSADGARVFVALHGKIQSFTTAPLTASWYFRSPGRNFRIQIRPRQGQIYSLRDSQIVIFPREPRKPAEGEKADPQDDALRVLDSPSHVDRIGFSPDGRLAVAAGRAMDVLVIVDATRGKIAGTWPEEAASIRVLLGEVDEAERPKGPRGRLVAQERGYSPPLGGDAAPADKSSPEVPGPAKTTETAQVDAASNAMTAATGVAPAPVKDPQASPPGIVTTGEPPQKVTDRPLVVPGEGGQGASRPVTPEEAALEEVEGSQLRGRISGDFASVAWVVIYGPGSITTERARVAPAADGSFAFDLPPRGRYRILLAGKPGVTLATRPSFQTLEVGEYGFAGIEFKVVGSVAP